MIAPLPSLAGAEWLVRPETQRVLTALTAAGFSARAVGGCVRNALMGLPVTDIDIATTALPEQTMAVARAAGMAAVPTGIEHGTVTVVCSHVPFEVTTLRRDIATDGRRAVVAFTNDWAEDAERRDFTMNALYCAGDGTVFDPLGGFADLDARRVRFIGDPAARIREDYLRILRFFRFHATYGVSGLDAAGARACVHLRAGLRQLSAERVGAEMMKLLVAPRAVDGLTAMFDFGLLVDVLGGVPRLARFTRLVEIEVAITIAGLSRPTPTLILPPQGRGDASADRSPALDSGVPSPLKGEGQDGGGAGKPLPDAALRLAALAVHGPEDAARLGGLLRLSREQQAVLEALTAMTWRLDAAATEHAAPVALYRLGAAGYQQRVLMDWAGSGARADDAKWLNLWTLPARLRVPVFPLQGRDLTALGVAPGPQIGELLRRLEQRWIDDGFTTSADELRALTLSWCQAPVVPGTQAERQL